ncbi:PTS system mannitol-specific IIC component [Microcella alkaliphila]|uniref:PTS system mannitol-specific EIICB component n=1 Tax=Microcella alkaliphila TaxID=279828 RepID=A0A4Q7TN07_9MICO|nr:PTS mannitol transporter subunit IICB [Microcella alkaliphila]RZT62221.1 PTS system mannitol-specific IIC component [Microcella alkaliphila]
MTTTSAPPARSGARVRVQRFGTFLSGMIMPNIAAFIAWGFITAFFIPTGWTPNEQLVQLVDPMILYLLPLLIANTGGRMVYGVRGGVVATIGTMGVIVGTSIPMFIGAMLMGPLAAWLMKQVDKIWAGKIRAGFEMLVDNFSAGILGFLLALGGFFGIAPVVTVLSDALGAGARFLTETGLLPLASLVIEPGKVLFLNNAINQGVLTPLGIQQAAQDGKSILFLLEANPGPGLGLLLAFALFGVGIARASAPGAIIIHFLGGIHEIYFPYVLMKPILIVAMIAGGATGITTNLIFGSGLRAPASPGSIFAVLLQTASDSYVGVVLSVVLSATVSFLVASLILRASRKKDLAAIEAGTDTFGASVAQNAENKGGESKVASLLGTDTATAVRIDNVVFACDAGMGSSAMGATILRKKFADAGLADVTVTNVSIANLDETADLVITHQDLTARATEAAPQAQHISVENFMSSPKYDEVVALVKSQRV